MPFQHQFEIAEILTKYLKGEVLTSAEEDHILAWISEKEENAALWKKISDPDYVQQNLDAFWETDKDAYWQKLLSEISFETSETLPGSKVRYIPKIRKLQKYAAVIVGIMLVGSVLWLLFGQDILYDNHRSAGVASHKPVKTNKDDQVLRTFRDSGAQLIMGNGRVVYLDTHSGSAIIEKDGTKLENKSSELVYAMTETEETPVFNTLITPRGSTYQLKLSDGTEITLNSGSTLRYPTQFKENVRQVFLTGEAYFDVAHDERHPFIVSADKVDITVLGTRFNVSSYPDDPLQKTTLFQGSVKITEEKGGGKKKEVLLKPGYEAVIQKNEGKIVVNRIKDENEPGWKENMLVFENETLGNIMRKLGREYDIRVVFKQGVDSNLHFTGRIKIEKDIQDLLELIQLTGNVKFVIKDGELWVVPTDEGEIIKK